MRSEMHECTKPPRYVLVCQASDGETTAPACGHEGKGRPGAGCYVGASTCEQDGEHSRCLVGRLGPAGRSSSRCRFLSKLYRWGLLAARAWSAARCCCSLRSWPCMPLLAGSRAAIVGSLGTRWAGTQLLGPSLRLRAGGACSSRRIRCLASAAFWSLRPPAAVATSELDTLAWAAPFRCPSAPPVTAATSKAFRAGVCASQGLWRSNDTSNSTPASSLDVTHMFYHMFRFGSDPRQWLEKCSRGKGVQDGDLFVRVFRVCNGIPWCDEAYDQRSLSSLACIETTSRPIQSSGDACSAGGSAGSGCGHSELLSDGRPPDDLVPFFPRPCAAKKGKEGVELHSARSRMLELRTVPSYKAAGAVVDSALPAPGGRARGRKCDNGRGRGLQPPGEA